MLAQPGAIVRGDESAKTRQARMVRRTRLQIGENLPHRLAHDRPIKGALPQHQARMADRPAHDHIYEAVHRGARCLSVGDILDRGGKCGAVDVKGRVFRFGAEDVRLSPKGMAGSAPLPRQYGTSRRACSTRANERISGPEPPYAGARWR